MTSQEWNEKTFAKFVYINDIHIHQNGKEICYVITKPNLDKDRYESSVVVESMDGGRKYIPDASMPRFSKGHKLSFVKQSEKKDDKSAELYIMDLRTSTYRKILEAKYIMDIRWKDDRFLLVKGIKKREDEDFIFEEDIPVWFDNKGFFDGEKTTFWICDSESGEIIEEFTEEKFSDALWHGDYIVVSVPHREGGKIQFFKFYDIYLYKDGNREKIFENVSFWAEDSDGKNILFMGKPHKEKISEHNYLYLWNSKELIPITEKFGKNNMKGKIRKSRIYFIEDDRGKMVLSSVKDEERVDVCKEDAWVVDFDVSRDGERIVFLKMTEAQLPEVYLWSATEGIRKITDYNGPVLSKLKPKKAKHFSFRSMDLEIDGWYLKPDLKEGGRAPVIVFVHGGPKGMYGHRFVYEMQMMAAKGYYVVYFNPRGSNGYSEDFALRVLGRTGLEDFQDILNGINEFLKIEKGADANRIGITGISYGGFMTNWAMTHSDIFKAGISENGISYWLTSYAFSDIGLWFDREVIGDNPLENENYRKLSPIFYVKNVKHPILIIHSMEDYRCPLDQSVMFYHLLKEEGKEAYIAVFKKGSHGHSLRASPKHRAKRYKLFYEFFERKLKKYEEGFKVEEIFAEIDGQKQ